MIDVKRLWQTQKKRIIGVTAGVTAAAVGCGIWYYAGHNSKDPVYVYPFQYIGMTEYWGDSQESHGPVTTDKIQTVYLSDTQTVTELLVEQGDAVKKGDILMRFDTTLSDLQLERQRLEVERLKLQQEDAKEELRQINGMKPMEIPEESDEEEEAPKGVTIENEIFPRIKSKVFLEDRRQYDGSSAEKALIYWIRSGKNINDALFAEADKHAAKLRELNKPEDPDEVGEKKQVSEEEEPMLPDGTVFYVVIKVSANNDSLGEKRNWQCLRVTKNGSEYVFRFADTVIPDYSMKAYLVEETEDETEEESEEDFGSGYTAAEIAQMRSDKQREIKDLDFEIKMANAEYKIMQKELGDGNVYADHDGEVVSLLDEEEARQTGQPMLKVSGGGGFYVEGFISELEKENMKPGMEATINDWNTGMTYTGTVNSIGDFPTQDGYYNGSGNPNASYYPFKVFVDESADLQAGSYVSVTYSTADNEHGIYLENPFLRTEKGKSYVLVLGADGKLEQRWVRTGKSLWGNYTEILDGLTEEDLIAFPYGKNVKPGVAAQEGDMSNLYG